MDLTNIKPCVECKKYSSCSPANFSYSDWEYCCTEKVDKRIYALFVDGEDCFEEVDDGQHT